MLKFILLVFICSKPDLTASFNDISISQAKNLASLFGLKIPELNIEGKASIKIVLKRNYIYIFVHKIYIKNDPIKWIQIKYSRKEQHYWLKSEALGGIIELEGVLWKD